LAQTDVRWQKIKNITANGKALAKAGNSSTTAKPSTKV